MWGLTSRQHCSMYSVPSVRLCSHTLNLESRCAFLNEVTIYAVKSDAFTNEPPNGPPVIGYHP